MKELENYQEALNSFKAWASDEFQLHTERAKHTSKKWKIDQAETLSRVFGRAIFQVEEIIRDTASVNSQGTPQEVDDWYHEVMDQAVIAFETQYAMLKATFTSDDPTTSSAFKAWVIIIGRMKSAIADVDASARVFVELIEKLFIDFDGERFEVQRQANSAVPFFFFGRRNYRYSLIRMLQARSVQGGELYTVERTGRTRALGIYRFDEATKIFVEQTSVYHDRKGE